MTKTNTEHSNNNSKQQVEQQLSKKPRLTSSKIEISKPSHLNQIKKSKTARLKRTRVASTALFEMVWAYIRGYRNWPGIIEAETPKGRYKIHFFGDYTTSEVSKNKIMHLLEGFKDYSPADSTTLLYKAISEAQLFILDKNRTECPICQMMKLKGRMGN